VGWHLDEPFDWDHLSFSTQGDNSAATALFGAPKVLSNPDVVSTASPNA